MVDWEVGAPTQCPVHFGHPRISPALRGFVDLVTHGRILLVELGRILDEEREGDGSGA